MIKPSLYYGLKLDKFKIGRGNRTTSEETYQEGKGFNTLGYFISLLSGALVVMVILLVLKKNIGK